MELPIFLDVEEDTIWTTYKSERDKILNADELKTFVKRWKNLFTNVNEESLTDAILAKIKSEKMDEDANVVAELVIPVKIFNAMLVAKEYVVPLNCAFIQMNGGLGEFGYD